MATEVYLDIYDSKTDPVGDEQGGVQYPDLYAATYQLLHDNFGFHEVVDDPKTGIFPRPTQFSTWASAQADGTPGAADKLQFVSVYGLLLTRNYTDPSMGRGRSAPLGPRDQKLVVDLWGGGTRNTKIYVAVTERFSQEFTQAVKDFFANRALFEAAFPTIRDQGKRSPTADTSYIYARQLAEVVDRLARDNVSANDPHISVYVERAMAQAVGAELEGRASSIDISLPDLDVGTTVDILKDNVRSLAGVYFSAMLEEMKLYAVMDKVVEHFTSGMLPFGRGPAGDRIYEWIRSAPQRFTEVERKTLYGRTLGVATGAMAGLSPNREFTDLWTRFLSATVTHFREQGSTVDGRTLVVAPSTVSAEVVHKAARDLGVNLSLHGFAIAHFGAVELQAALKEILSAITSAELLAAYGVQDQWQLVERVSSMYLGGAANGVRYRTMAKAGSDIILWIADHAPTISKGTITDCSTFFRDRQLVTAAEAWLAVTGTSHSNVEKYSDPVDLQSQPAIPSMLPSNLSTAMRGMLDRIGTTNVGQA